MYQHARYWYAANSKRCVNRDQAAWTFYQRFMQCANDAGFAAARHSPMWHWGRDDLWDSDDPGARHMGETGQHVWAARLAAWLDGQEWEPYFRVPVSVHDDLLAIDPDTYVSPGIITVDGGLLRVNVSIVARNPDYQAPATSTHSRSTAGTPRCWAWHDTRCPTTSTTRASPAT